MIRPLALPFAAGMALLTTTLCRAGENFPVVHNDPITVRILGGKDGRPLVHYHVLLIAGYDPRDLHEQLYRQEALTDTHGQARLSKQLANLPWLQVWVNKKPLCQVHPRSTSFSVELIRRDGLSAPNRCGIATVEDAPGVFTVFVKRGAKKAPKESLAASAPARIPAPDAPPKITFVAEASAPQSIAIETPAQKPVQAEATLPAPQPVIAVVAVASPITQTPAPVEVALKTTPPAKTAAFSPTAFSAKDSTVASDKAEVHRSVRQVAGIPAAYRKTTPSYRRARPVLASCQEPQPTAPVEAINASRKPKPAAGVRVNVAKPGKVNLPLKQE